MDGTGVGRDELATVGLLGAVAVASEVGTDGASAREADAAVPDTVHQHQSDRDPGRSFSLRGTVLLILL